MISKILALSSSRDPGPLRRYDGKCHPAGSDHVGPCSSLLHTAKNQLLDGAALAGRFAFEFAIQGIGNVDRRSHVSILPYLWLNVCQWETRKRNFKRPEQPRSGLGTCEWLG